MDLNKLREPFKPEDIEWRVQQQGEKNGKLWAMVVAYVDNRAIMERLDDTVGAGNWRNEFRHGPDGAVLCGLSIRIRREPTAESAEWVTKWDGAENTDIEGVKGGLSGSMKRAAVQWGIGRYLYDLPPGFAEILPEGQRGRFFNRKPPFHWNPPKLPAWALPAVPAEERDPRARALADSAVAQSNALERAKPLASDPPAQQPTREAAVAEAHRALPIQGTYRLPGSKSNLMGYGGKLLVEVPIEHLPAIRDKLAENEKYSGAVTAINDYLEAMRID